MAYVLWRVFMKKYTKVRLGIRNLPVNPAERQTVPEREETWTLASESREDGVALEHPGGLISRKPRQESENRDEGDEVKESLRSSSVSRSQSQSSEYEPNLPRSHETRKSKTKRMKNYLKKKCKDALLRSDENPGPTVAEKRRDKSTSWYVDEKGSHDAEVIPRGSGSSLYEDATELSSSAQDEPAQPLGNGSSLETLVVTLGRNCESSDTLVETELTETQENAELIADASPEIRTVRPDVATLVRNLLEPIYGSGVIDLLTRQARDLLVCSYHGNHDEFLRSFLSPAATLLAEAKKTATENGNESVVPKGWPLTLGEVGLVIHLGELEASSVRPGECYLCVREPRPTTSSTDQFRPSSPELALVWRSPMRAPGILGWDREDEYMDWRESQKRGGAAEPRAVSTAATLAKSRSTSNVESWQEDAGKTERRRRGGTSSPGVESRPEAARIKRGTSVSPTTVENWKGGNSRWETRSRALGLAELRTPFDIEAAVAVSCEPRPDALSDEELPGFIGTLLVSVERAIERVSIDDLPFPCPVCRHADTDDPLLGCNCVAAAAAANVSGEASHTFEVAGIKHIDSDDEEEVRMGFGARKKGGDPTPPRNIHDLPDHLLACGLTLPGYKDSCERPVIEYDSTVSPSEAISPVEVASLILYLAHLPSSDRSDTEFTLLVTGEPSEELDLLDNAFHLLQRTLRIHQALILRNSPCETSGKTLLPRSQITVVFIDERTIRDYIPKREERPDQSRWIAFFKEYDTAMSEWQTSGRKLALAMSELKECSTMITRSLMPLSRLLADPSVKRTPADAEEAIAVLEERAAGIEHIEQVRFSMERARRLLTEVGNAAARLESSCESRRAAIRNLTVLRSIEDQAHEALSWLCKKGEETLSRHSRPPATTLLAARVHERDFEKFYFTSMKHLDKGSDLAEAANTSGLRELARSLKQHLRGFGSRLEDTRERLEDTSRCFLLLDRAYEWALEATRVVGGDRRVRQFLMARPPLPQEHFTEMLALAEKLGNEPLLEQCRVARNRCSEALELARSASAPGSPGSPACRRSFGATASWEDAAAAKRESIGFSPIPSRRPGTSWDDSDSASSSCPADGSSAGIGPGSGSGTRPALDNIAELRESAEQLLDSSPPRSPPRSPAIRRLAKPPVNSHLHRAPSIAPGMKAKKTILLIMREMIQTERDYVKSLEYIIENYIPELVREDIPQALRGQRNVIFGNVEKIYEFHSQHFLRELEQCEQCPMFVGQCFIRHEKKFYLYALYNKNKPNSDSLMAEYGTAFFKTKQLELGDKMDLASYLLKPVQRMGKYALLLQQLVKAGTDLSDRIADRDGKEDKEDKPDTNEEKEDKEEEPKPIVEGEADLRAAEQMVRFQLRHGNDLLAMDSLRDCDVNVKEQGRLLRQNEFLVWQGKGKKCLRQVFLFEDLILFSKARRFPDRKNLDIYIYKNSIKTTDIGLTAVIADSPTKFEIWFRKRKPGDTYTLQCANEDIKKAWTEELSNLLWKQALRNREVRLAEMSSMGIGNKPCLDIRPSADQINDRSISVAQLSKTPRFRNSIAVSISDDSGRCSRRPHSVISVSSSSSSGGSSGPAATLHLGLDTSPRPHHRSTTLNSQCSVESGIIADISIVSDDGGEGAERSHWNSSLESPTSHVPATSTPLRSPTNAASSPTAMQPSSPDGSLTPYDQDMSINL